MLLFSTCSLQRDIEVHVESKTISMYNQYTNTYTSNVYTESGISFGNFTKNLYLSEYCSRGTRAIITVILSRVNSGIHFANRAALCSPRLYSVSIAGMAQTNKHG